MESTNPIFNVDGYEDIAKGFNNPLMDASVGTTVGLSSVIPDPILARYWLGDGLAKRIITVPVDDALRAGYEIQGTEDPKRLTDELKRLKFRAALKLAAYWQRLYGGSLICIGSKDGLNVDQPAIYGKEISYIKTYPRTAVTIQPMDIEIDPASPRFGEPNFYTVQPNGVLSGGQVKWHYTRVVPFRGESLPEDAYNMASADLNIRYWGVSVLQGLTDRLNDLGVSFQGIGTLLKESAVGIYSIHGLSDALAAGRADLIKNRLQQMQMAKSIIRAVCLDSGGTKGGATVPAEQFTRDQLNFTGIPETMALVQGIISGMSGIPETKLYGAQARGLGGKDEGSMRNYYDMVKEYEENDLDAIALDVIQRVNAYIKAVPPTAFTLRWKSPWEPSQAEQVEMRNKQAQTDKIYFDMQAVDNDEIRENRFAGEASLETSVEGPAPKMETIAPPAPKAPQAKPAKAK